MIRVAQTSSFEIELIDLLCEIVPDTSDPDELVVKIENDRMILWLEGWSDACLSGTGYPVMEEGMFEEKQMYIADISHQEMSKIAHERGLSLKHTGFVPRDDRIHLYGISWAIFDKS